MRVLFILLAPLLGYSQLDTTLTYRKKYVHKFVVEYITPHIVCDIDTVKCRGDYKIKFNKADSTIYIEKYGTYKYTNYTPTHSLLAHSYKLKNGGDVCWTNKSVIWAFPLVGQKAKTIIFEVSK